MEPSLYWGERSLYWGYLHESYTIKVRVFRHMLNIEDAYQSEFVMDVYGPFGANSIDEALRTLVEHFETYYELPEHLYE